ncbi:MAG: L,D-transpeptidase family protein [Acidimicrobiales bacterium]
MTTTTARARRFAIAAALLVLGACGSDSAPVTRLGQPVVDSETTTSSTSPSTSTTLATTTTAPRPPTSPAPPLPGMGTGARGPQVLALEQRLDALHYDVGSVDGVYDRVTAYAVTAFQKVHGFGRNGRATDEIVAAIQSAEGVPAPLVADGGPDRVEVDIGRQVLFLYRGGELGKILPVSTGSGRRFCSEGYCRRAVTPGGAFQIYRQAGGWEYGPLGGLYKPHYFNGGIAIHGAPSVPTGPASHGCVRIPMNAAEWFPSQVGIGTAVYVIGGPEDVPPPAPAPAAVTQSVNSDSTDTPTGNGDADGEERDREARKDRKKD